MTTNFKPYKQLSATQEKLVTHMYQNNHYIVVDDTNSFTVWVEDRKLQNVPYKGLREATINRLFEIGWIEHTRMVGVPHHFYYILTEKAIQELRKIHNESNKKEE